MEYSIEIIKKTRQLLLENLKELTEDQLNQVPEGFNNNIIWNIGHLIAAQQGICYLRAGLSPILDDKYIAPFKAGTKPETVFNGEEISYFKELFISTIDKLSDDCTKDSFAGYAAWSTRVGIEIKNINDALKFLAFHEGLHTGAIVALKKMVTK